MKLPSPMGPSGRFSRVPVAELPRSQFDRSHGHKTTFDVGYLIPVFWDEVLPGDTLNLRMTGFVRLSTPVKPIMDNMYLDTFFFFVPYRLVWANFVKMMGEQEDPGDSISFTVPQRGVAGGGILAGTVADYLGVPTEVGASVTAWTYNALPHRCYYKIWNEWFRDQNLQDGVSQQGQSGVSFGTGDGPDSSTNNGGPLLQRGKRHDYFTSCLPWAQKGTAPDLPIDIVTDNTDILLKGASSSQEGHVEPAVSTGLPGLQIRSTSTAFSANENLRFGSNTGLETELTINELRETLQIQKLLERDARSGTRYPEILMSHFRVQDPMHLVLQRPEYLGGGSTPVVVNAVAQTSETGVTEQGNLAGIGTAVSQGDGFVKSFTEHGIVMGLVSVRADLTYQQGLERAFSRSTRYDFYWPAFAHLGEQAVLNKEIYLQDHQDDDAAFGYQERWSEYRYKPSKVTGEFRSNHANTLEVWHLAQDYASLPVLDATWIVENPDMARILASSTNDHFLADFYFKYICARPLPMHSIPGFTGKL